jgi:hypothetical protein
MRISRAFFILVCVSLFAGQISAVAQKPKYGVSVKTSKPAALAKARTYVWTVASPSYNKSVDAMIVAAIDRELGVRGFTKLPSGPSDVTVSYASLGRTDVDVKDTKNAPKDGAAREYAVGTLVVDLSEPTHRQLLFRVRMDTPIERDPATIEATINAVVAAMFEKYPSQAKR